MHMGPLSPLTVSSQHTINTPKFSKTTHSLILFVQKIRRGSWGICYSHCHCGGNYRRGTVHAPLLTPLSMHAVEPLEAMPQRYAAPTCAGQSTSVGEVSLQSCACRCGSAGVHRGTSRNVFSQEWVSVSSEYWVKSCRISRCLSGNWHLSEERAHESQENAILSSPDSWGEQTPSLCLPHPASFSISVVENGLRRKEEEQKDTII